MLHLSVDALDMYQQAALWTYAVWNFLNGANCDPRVKVWAPLVFNGTRPKELRNWFFALQLVF
jgi:hypothetical protein